jgi:hypothetical protein
VYRREGERAVDSRERTAARGARARYPYPMGDGNCAQTIEGIGVAGEVAWRKGRACLLAVEKRGRSWVLRTDWRDTNITNVIISVKTLSRKIRVKKSSRSARERDQTRWNGAGRSTKVGLSRVLACEGVIRRRMTLRGLVASRGRSLAEVEAGMEGCG